MDLTSTKWADQFSDLALFVFVVVVSAYVTIAHYVGSSMLIGAFCAGSLMSHCWKTSQAALELEHEPNAADSTTSWSPHHAFHHISPVQNTILSPFFFASIGAAIPVRSLFRATTAWRGIIYSALMLVAKVAAGEWLPLWTTIEQRLKKTTTAPSWPAGLFVGLALVTRGEIGLLILNLAQSEGLVSEEAFGVGIWAVVLNTLLGPIGVGRLLQTRAVHWVVGGPWGIRGE
jgi:Kef-type K+ transport system membrane component KefB